MAKGFLFLPSGSREPCGDDIPGFKKTERKGDSYQFPRPGPDGLTYVAPSPLATS
jgi:hypothetical protein